MKAAEMAATYLGMIPSDETMLNNVRYYTHTYKLQPDDFSPREVRRGKMHMPIYMHYYTMSCINYYPSLSLVIMIQEYVAITEKLSTEKRLLHFATHRELKKKQGKRGDDEQRIHHQEL